MSNVKSRVEHADYNIIYLNRVTSKETVNCIMRIKQCSRTNSSSAIFGTDRRNEFASRLQWGEPGRGCAPSESVLNLIACPLTLRSAVGRVSDAISRGPCLQANA